MKDNFNHFESCQLTDPATATTTVTSNCVDLAGFNSVTVLWSVGESGDTLSGTVYWTLKLQECDTQAGTYTDVSATEIISDAATVVNSVVVDAAAEDDRAYRLGYTGNARYLRAVVTATGTHTYGTPMAIIALMGHERVGPGASTSIASLASV